MNEMHIDRASEEQKQQEERYAQWMADHPEAKISEENLRECEPEIAKFEELITSFESTYSLEELLSITDLASKEGQRNPLREQAKVALNPIFEMLTTLKKETNISLEKCEELKEEYKRLSRAVGMTIEGDKIDHSR
ncbi:MAG: hypothetical protein WCV80_03880 [Candidatus Paceibacterota bacterium]|jgi:hypothetical protein